MHIEIEEENVYIFLIIYFFIITLQDIFLEHNLSVHQQSLFSQHN